MLCLAVLCCAVLYCTTEHGIYPNSSNILSGLCKVPFVEFYRMHTSTKINKPIHAFLLPWNNLEVAGSSAPASAGSHEGTQPQVMLRVRQGVHVEFSLKTLFMLSAFERVCLFWVPCVLVGMWNRNQKKWSSPVLRQWEEELGSARWRQPKMGWILEGTVDRNEDETDVF